MRTIPNAIVRKIRIEDINPVTGRVIHLNMWRVIDQDNGQVIGESQRKWEAIQEAEHYMDDKNHVEIDFDARMAAISAIK